jgi:hypothetical protein
LLFSSLRFDKIFSVFSSLHFDEVSNKLHLDFCPLRNNFKWIKNRLEEHSEDDTSLQHLVLVIVAESIPIDIISLLGFVRRGGGQKFFITIAYRDSFCTFHFSSYLYSAFVPGRRSKSFRNNSTPAQSATVMRHFQTAHGSTKFF